MGLKKGDKLIAKDNLEMLNSKGEPSGAYALIKGKEYPITKITEYFITVKSELFEEHNFSTDFERFTYWDIYFEAQNTK